MPEDYLYIGSVPIDEDCAPVGAENYRSKAKRECRAFAKQLKRVFPDGDFRIKEFDHDFGMYLEVVAFFDDENDSDPRKKAAFDAESNTPLVWDEQAREDLHVPKFSGLHTVGDLLEFKRNGNSFNH